MSADLNPRYALLVVRQALHSNGHAAVYMLEELADLFERHAASEDALDDPRTEARLAIRAVSDRLVLTRSCPTEMWNEAVSAIEAWQKGLT